MGSYTLSQSLHVVIVTIYRHYVTTATWSHRHRWDTPAGPQLRGRGVHR